MGGIRTSLSAIQAGMTRQGVAAANIAGAVAEDYEVLRVEAISGVTDGVQTQVRPDPRDRIDISEQAVELIRAEHDIAVNVHVLQRLDELDEALMGMRDEPT